MHPLRVHEICRVKYGRGMSLAQISREEGIHYQTLHKWKTKEKWVERNELEKQIDVPLATYEESTAELTERVTELVERIRDKLFSEDFDATPRDYIAALALLEKITARLKPDTQVPQVVNVVGVAGFAMTPEELRKAADEAETVVHVKDLGKVR